MRIGILTGGGDCPGLNAVIRADVRKGIQEYGDEFVGFKDGWRGVLEADTVPMDLKAIRGILPRGGTVLGTSRTTPYKTEDGEARVFATLEKLGVEALVPIGGEDTLGVATKLAASGVPVVDRLRHTDHGDAGGRELGRDAEGVLAACLLYTSPSPRD